MPSKPDQRPASVTAIATLFASAAAYLILAGLIMLLRPGAISMASGAALLGGLETWGPYMFLLAGFAGIIVAFGLFRLNNLARRTAALLAIAGIVLLVPRVSGAVVSFHFQTLFWSGLGIMVRVVIAFYLYQEPVRAVFEEPKEAPK